MARIKASKLEFNIVIGRSDNGSNRRQSFVTMRCERSDTYVPPIRKLKRDDTRSRKCECLFKLHGYRKVDDTWKFNVISGLHNHALQNELVGYPIVCCLKPEEKKIVSDMSLIRVVPKNIFANLKQKKPESVSNIKQVHSL
ncbi:uncharacterized protein LOC127094994 [Lathyrus oleraceus]|uniref:uncharacterized protein LOC127094994 n=1 Tax=Pisum sativum TaxID=3888 RepID=UPI0021CFA94A|nr:uncharacterized protein LOC127094994 [Pisum sativum]